MSKNSCKIAKYSLFIGIFLVVIIAAYSGWFPFAGLDLPYRLGYFIGISVLALGLTGLWLPNTHLFHHYVFRFMAYSGIVILVVLAFYPILIDVILQIKTLK
jgi:hypothetical protein